MLKKIQAILNANLSLILQMPSDKQDALTGIFIFCQIFYPSIQKFYTFAVQSNHLIYY